MRMIGEIERITEEGKLNISGEEKKKENRKEVAGEWLTRNRMKCGETRKVKEKVRFRNGDKRREI